MGKIFKYIRTSTSLQNESRQIDKNVDSIYVDKCSGLIPFYERPEARKLIEILSSGDKLIIHSVDRLGRNKMDMLSVLHDLKEKKVNVRIENLGIESFLPNGKFNSVFDIITTLLSSISEYEKEQLSERTKEGIAIARAKGKYKGRALNSIIPKEKYLKDNKDVVKVIEKYPEMSLRELAKLAEVSHSKIKKIKDIL